VVRPPFGRPGGYYQERCLLYYGTIDRRFRRPTAAPTHILLAFPPGFFSPSLCSHLSYFEPVRPRSVLYIIWYFKRSSFARSVRQSLLPATQGPLCLARPCPCEADWLESNPDASQQLGSIRVWGCGWRATRKLPGLKSQVLLDVGTVVCSSREGA
jgi:hypothetical protein